MFCRTHIQIQLENKQNAQSRKRNADSTPKSQAKAHSNEVFGSSTDMGRVQAHRGTDHAKVVTRQAHQGAGTPLLPPLRPTFLWRLHVAMHRRFPVVSLFFTPNQPPCHYIRRSRAHSPTHIIWSYTPYLSTCNL